MKTMLALCLGFPVVWLLSALLHTIDPDINGIQGLAAPEILVSVTAIAVFLFLPALVPLLAFRVWGRWGYGLGLGVASGAVGLAVAALGSSATSVAGWMVSFAGATLVCAAVFALSTLPGLLSLSRASRLKPVLP